MSVVFSYNIKNNLKPKTVTMYPDGGVYLKGTNGATVILIHGLTGTPNEMKFLAGFLNRKGYSVFCPRLANHGEPIEVLKKTHWKDFYASVKEVMVSSQIANGKGPIFASGLSMGALLALLLADEFKDRIKGVSCLAPTLFYDGWNTPESKFLLPLAYRTPIRYFFYFKEQPPYGIKNEIVQQRVHKYYCDAKISNIENISQYGYPFFPVTLLHQLYLLVAEITRRLPHMEFPVQLIQAKDDDMASVKNSQFIYDRIKSEEKEMILLYDSYHVITADQERGVVAEKMLGFFNRNLNKKTT